MGLVTNITKKVDIPGEPESAEIRKLSHTQLKAAAKARQSEGVDFMRQLGGELMKAMQDSDTEKVKKLQNAQEADISNYDRDTLLREGIVSWTYDVPPRAINGSGVTDGIDQLDEPTAKFLAEEIFKFSRPETVAEAKNG